MFHKHKTALLKYYSTKENKSHPIKGASRLSDLLFGLDVDYDDVEGDGDIIVDDMLISASEGEPFEKTLEGKKHIYKISGGE